MRIATWKIQLVSHCHFMKGETREVRYGSGKGCEEATAHGVSAACSMVALLCWLMKRLKVARPILLKKKSFEAIMEIFKVVLQSMWNSEQVRLYE